MKKEFWIYFEEESKKSFSGSLALLGKASSIRNPFSAVCAVVAGPRNSRTAHILAAAGANRIYFSDSFLTSERQAALSIAALAQTRRPDIFLFPATVCCKNVAAQISALLKTGLTADCTGLSIDSQGLLVQTRPAYGGSLTADIVCPKARPQMATVRCGLFPAPAPDFTKTADCLLYHASLYISPVSLISREPVISSESLLHGDIVVAGGAGIGTAENFQELGNFARKIGASLGASRGAVNAGFIRPEYQIGQTGSVIRPKLYIAAAISGAVQHLSGISQAGCIIAINQDPCAPIFSFADLALVCHWRDGIHAILKEFQSTIS